MTPTEQGQSKSKTKTNTQTSKPSGRPLKQERNHEGSEAKNNCAKLGVFTEASRVLGLVPWLCACSVELSDPLGSGPAGPLSSWAGTQLMRASGSVTFTTLRRQKKKNISVRRTHSAQRVPPPVGAAKMPPTASQRQPAVSRWLRLVGLWISLRRLPHAGGNPESLLVRGEAVHYFRHCHQPRPSYQQKTLLAVSAPFAISPRFDPPVGHHSMDM